MREDEKAAVNDAARWARETQARYEAQEAAGKTAEDQEVIQVLAEHIDLVPGATELLRKIIQRSGNGGYVFLGMEERNEPAILRGPFPTLERRLRHLAGLGCITTLRRPEPICPSFDDQLPAIIGAMSICRIHVMVTRRGRAAAQARGFRGEVEEEAAPNAT